jgi:hypothetical protein
VGHPSDAEPTFDAESVSGAGGVQPRDRRRVTVRDEKAYVPIPRGREQMSTRSTRTATRLLVAALVVLVVPLVGSALTAPTIGAADPGTGSGEGPARTLVGSQGGGPGLHEDGSVYLLAGSDTAWREGSADSYFDVTMTDDGRVLAGFMHSGYTDCGPYDSPCTHTGYRVIDPSGGTPAVTAEYSFPVRTRKNSEVHDVEPLPSGELVLSDMEHERIFTVNEAGETTWQWNASDFYDAPDDPTRVDWLHINDVDYIGDDRFLVSVRNANQLVVVERGAGVVEVINADTDSADDGDCTQFDQLADTDGDGEVRCGDPDLLDHQHNPQWLGDGAVLVADSENDRIVELHRTESGWEEAWVLTRAEGVSFAWPRDADRLENGNTLVTDSANQRLVEVNESGETVWSYRTPLIPYEAERLPAGETVGASLYGTPGDGSGSSEVPLLSTLLQIVRTSLPIPFWVSELHVGTTLLAVVLALAGGGLHLRALVARRAG